MEIIKPRASINAMPPSKDLSVSVWISCNEKPAELVKKNPQGINPKILMLEIKYTMLDVISPDPKQVIYSEKLSSEKQYEKIEIYFEEEKIEEINKIPIYY